MRAWGAATTVRASGPGRAVEGDWVWGATHLSCTSCTYHAPILRLWCSPVSCHSRQIYHAPIMHLSCTCPAPSVVAASSSPPPPPSRPHPSSGVRRSTGALQRGWGCRAPSAQQSAEHLAEHLGEHLGRTFGRTFRPGRTFRQNIWAEQDRYNNGPNCEGHLGAAATVRPGGCSDCEGHMGALTRHLQRL